MRNKTFRHIAPIQLTGHGDDRCPFCAEFDTLMEVSTKVTIRPRSGGTLIIPNYTYTTCENCDAEFVTGDQAIHNDEVKFGETESN